MKSKVEKYLIEELEIPTRYKGFKYIVYANEIIEKEPNISTMELYDKIAKKFKTKRTRVERAIRYARQNKKIYKKTTKVTNREFIEFVNIMK